MGRLFYSPRNAIESYILGMNASETLSRALETTSEIFAPHKKEEEFKISVGDMQAIPHLNLGKFAHQALPARDEIERKLRRALGGKRMQIAVGEILHEAFFQIGAASQEAQPDFAITQIRAEMGKRIAGVGIVSVKFVPFMEDRDTRREPPASCHFYPEVFVIGSIKKGHPVAHVRIPATAPHYQRIFISLGCTLVLSQNQTIHTPGFPGEARFCSLGTKNEITVQAPMLDPEMPNGEPLEDIASIDDAPQSAWRSVMVRIPRSFESQYLPAGGKIWR